MVAIKSLVAIVNKAQTNLIQSFESYGAGTLKTMRGCRPTQDVLHGAWGLTLQLEGFGLDGDYHVVPSRKNKEVLKDLCKECLRPTTSAGGSAQPLLQVCQLTPSRPSISYSASPLLVGQMILIGDR